MSSPTNASKAAEWLVNNILSNHANSGRWANELCALIVSGTNANVLRPLLDSGNVESVTAAAFVLSETGAQSRVLLDYALPLSRHPSKRIRAYMVDFISQHGNTLSADIRQAVALLAADSEPEVRDYAVQLFRRAGIA
jgi:hypothetical protein